jgi:hypothetical protein
MLTHVVFGAGLGYAFLSTISGGPNLLLDAAFAVVVSYAINQLIDGLGHSSRGGRSVRSPLTHSVFTAPAWGVAVSYVLWAVGSAYGLLGGFVLYLVAGAVVAFSHLFLDSMTEGGVFFTTERIAIAHFGNNNLLMNVIFAMFGLSAFLI